MAEPAPALDAATVILLRDTPDGPEVFLQRRGAGAAFMAGAYVFPGGVVDDTDRGMPPELVDDPDADLLPLRVAAVRELFEEAGVLLATRNGVLVDDEFVTGPSATAVRRRLHDRADRYDWRPWLAEQGLVLATDPLALTSRWVTPVVEPRRFDTWFFAVEAPTTQDADHDDVEMTDSVWARPADALAAAEAGEVFMVPPTRRNLAALAAFDRAADAVAAAGGPTAPEPILPVIRQDDDGSVWVTHPTFEPIRIRRA